jgi:hypothetical protein
MNGILIHVPEKNGYGSSDTFEETERLDEEIVERWLDEADSVIIFCVNKNVTLSSLVNCISIQRLCYLGQARAPAIFGECRLYVRSRNTPTYHASMPNVTVCAPKSRPIFFNNYKDSNFCRLKLARWPWSTLWSTVNTSTLLSAEIDRVVLEPAVVVINSQKELSF